jgi:predicted TPR repeat methyltransferase
MSHFDKRADGWDSGAVRVNGAKIIAQAIKRNFTLHHDMEIMDFGVGTGLLGFEIAKDVHKVYGVDTSSGMLEKLQEKNTQELSIEPIHQDIVETPLDKSFDGIVSSMTLHHVENLQDFFTTIHANLKENGFIAIADLEEEDGTFHTDNAGVFHFGFRQNDLNAIVESCGFGNINFEIINTIQKPDKNYNIFLLSARRL